MPAAIDFTLELQTAILEGIESGLTLRQVAEQNSISAAFILKQVAQNKEFCEQYARVLELRTDADFEGLTDLVYEPPQLNDYGVDSGWVNWKRLQVDTIKWALSKRVPKKYGDLSKLELSGADGGPLVVKHIGSDGE